MSISNLLDIGGTSLIAQRVALDVIGENISNVNTPGYSRQNAAMVTGPTYTVNGLAFGNGVQVASVQRSYDSFVQSQIVAANADSGFATTSESTMGMIQPLFNDLSTSAGGGLSTQITDFFNAWQDLASNPQGVAERQAVLAKGNELADGFHSIAGNLTNVQNNMNQSLVGITSDINNDLKQIAHLNTQIQIVEAQGAQANELRDSRDLLIQQLSQKVQVKATEQPDGTMTVTDLSGDTMVAGKDYGSLALAPNAGNNGFNDVYFNPFGGAPTVNVTSTIGGPNNTKGSLGATLNIRDNVVKDYKAKLDELAGTLAAQVNGANSTGFGIAGSTGKNFFSGATADGIAVAIATPDDIAASSTDPTLATGGTGNNLNAQKIASIYNTTYPMTGGTMTLSDFYTSLMGTVGVDVQNATSSSTQASANMNQLNNLRDSVSGVSLDEELTNLTKYQTAYQGAAKLITTAQNMLDTLLGMVQ